MDGSFSSFRNIGTPQKSSENFLEHEQHRKVFVWQEKKNLQKTTQLSEARVPANARKIQFGKKLLRKVHEKSIVEV